MKTDKTFELWADCGYPPFYFGEELIMKERALAADGPKKEYLEIFEVMDAALKEEAGGREVAGAVTGGGEILPPPPRGEFSKNKPPLGGAKYKKIALCLDLNNDTQTKLLYSCGDRQTMIAEMQRSFLNMTAFSTTKMTSANVLPSFKDPSVTYISATGHGSALSVMGGDGKPLLSAKSPDLAAIAPGKVFFLTMCQTCVPEFGLGMTLVKNKAKCVFGYKNNLVISVDAGVNDAYFFPSFFAAELEFVKNNSTAQNSYLCGRRQYGQNIQKLANDPSVQTKDFFTAMLKYDLAIYCGPDSAGSPFGDPNYRYS